MSILSLLGLTACSAERPREASWRVEFNDDATRMAASTIVLRIREGSCAPDAEVVFEQTQLRSDRGMAMAPPALMPGTWAFEAEARGEDCRNIAWGCVTTDLPLDSDDILLSLRTIEEPPECNSCDCQDGVCRTDSPVCGDPPVTPILRFPTNGASTGSVHLAASLHPTFRWERSELADRYELELDSTCEIEGFADCPFSAPTRVTDITETSHALESALEVSMSAPVGRRYHWRVRACNASGCSAYSPIRYLNVGRLQDDFNGDGYPDAVLGAIKEEGGVVYIYNGGSTIDDQWMPSVRIANPIPLSAGDDGSFSVDTGGGDINGDGFADLVVGANVQDAGQIDEGAAHVYLGSVNGLPTTPSMSLANPQSLREGRFGTQVTLGELNADGYQDVIVGASRQPDRVPGGGAVYVYLGSADGVSATPSLSVRPAVAEEGARFGSALTTGDFDADGRSDLVVGALNQGNEGFAYIYLGTDSGLDDQPWVGLPSPDGSDGGLFGEFVTAGHLNGDAFDDILISGPRHRNSGELTGMFQLLHGAAREPVADVMRFNPAPRFLGLFGSSAGISDFNGDGLGDVLVSARGNDPDRSGAAYLYLNSTTGLAETYELVLHDPSSTTGLDFGRSTRVMDLNVDGHPDVLIGSPWGHAGDDGCTGEHGRVLIFMGLGTGLVDVTPIILVNPVSCENDNSFGWDLGD